MTKELNRPKTYVLVDLLCPLMKRDDTNINYLVVLGAWLMMMTATVIGIDWNTISPVFASVNRSILLLTDLHLEECIKQLQLGNPEDALNHCQLAYEELGVLLNNTTGK